MDGYCAVSFYDGVHFLPCPFLDLVALADFDPEVRFFLIRVVVLEASSVTEGGMPPVVGRVVRSRLPIFLSCLLRLQIVNTAARMLSVP